MLGFINVCNPLNGLCQSSEIGLLSTLEIKNLKVQPKITLVDLGWHNKIDSTSGIQSFLNKVLVVNNKKLYVSLHTKSTVEDVVLKLKTGKIRYDSAFFFIYQNTHFACFQFKTHTKIIHRIIFSEPKLTSVNLIDFVDDRKQLKSFNYKTIIQGLKLNSRIN